MFLFNSVIFKKWNNSLNCYWWKWLKNWHHFLIIHSILIWVELGWRLHMCYTYIKACIDNDTQNVNEPSEFTIAAKTGNTGKSIRIVTGSILDIFSNFKSLLWSRITKFINYTILTLLYGTEVAIILCWKIFFKMLFFAGCLYDFR